MGGRDLIQRGDPLGVQLEDAPGGDSLTGHGDVIAFMKADESVA
jgi:hypothetical protein